MLSNVFKDEDKEPPAIEIFPSIAAICLWAEFQAEAKELR
jgi:hypothetical protein